MDLIKSVYESIEEQISQVDQAVGGGLDDDDVIACDRNLNRILDQQAEIKMIIERDGQIKSSKRVIETDKMTIESIRKAVARMGLELMKERQDLIEVQSKELEKFQVQQLKSISEDFKKHQQILEQRRREIEALKKETENEENNRDQYLENIVKELDKGLEGRRRNGRAGDTASILDEATDAALVASSLGGQQDDVQLISVDEYAPYGAAAHSRTGGTSSSTSKGANKRRGRKKNDG